MFRKISLFLILVFFTTIACSEVSAQDNDRKPAGRITQLVDNGGYGVLKQGEYVTTLNLHQPYIPASTIKIATALAALEVLGPSFRFETLFYRDSLHNLYIKGFGDPFLVSEEVALMVRKLKEAGCREINDIYLDGSAFELEGPAAGKAESDNPYDAENSGLAVNFNTINIRILTNGRVVSAEAQTPTLPVMNSLGEDLPPGVHRINIGRAESDGDNISSRYAGELVRAFQQQENISGNGLIVSGKVPAGLELIYRHRSSKRLVEIIGPLMLYSNNFIANQLFLAVGAVEFGYPATWEKSQQAVSAFLQKKYNLAAQEIFLLEGSGLSRKNRVSPHAMLQLLDAFKPYADLLPHQDDRLLKSGTLQGVYAYAGYFSADDRLDSFVLLLNQAKNNRDIVLDMLEDRYRRY